jgi:hypothetical protein
VTQVPRSSKRHPPAGRDGALGFATHAVGPFDNRAVSDHDPRASSKCDDGEKRRAATGTRATPGLPARRGRRWYRARGRRGSQRTSTAHQSPRPIETVTLSEERHRHACLEALLRARCSSGSANPSRPSRLASVMPLPRRPSTPTATCGPTRTTAPARRSTPCCGNRRPRLARRSGPFEPSPAKPPAD